MTERDAGLADRPMQVLIVDDEDIMRRVWRRILKQPEFELRFATNAEDAFNVLARAPFDVVVLDVIMPGLSGMEALPRIKSRWPDIEVVMMTAYGGMDSAVQAVALGAYDFLTKPFISVESAALAIRHAGLHKRLIDRARSLDGEVRTLRDERELREVLGCSPRMQDAVRLAAAAAATSSPVLIQGEAGTEKELIARLLHRQSARRSAPFLALNCASLSESALEVELFGRGHGDGKQGLVEAARGGTLFLDEIAGVSLRLQLRLLDVLVRAEAKVEGGDARLVAATTRELEPLVEEGRFRDDLNVRLAGHRIRVPALRERVEDIGALTHVLLQRAARKQRKTVLYVAREALLALQMHAWPGNVRELESVVERAVALATGDTITARELPEGMESGDAAGVVSDAMLSQGYRDAKDRATAGFERVYVQMLLERVGGNVSEAARLAGLDRSNFRRVLKRARKTVD